jgi:hypothetical protein
MLDQHSRRVLRDLARRVLRGYSQEHGPAVRVRGQALGSESQRHERSRAARCRQVHAVTAPLAYRITHRR